jgi:hypothetical protein
MDGLKDFISRKIVIVGTNGFRQFGFLKSSDETGLILQLNDGREVFVPMATIASISLDQR